MNDRKSSLPDGSGQDKGGGAPVSLSRRRFAKGAAPVVLGTLVSTPVLGAAPYHCTVSGHVSGDASPRVGHEDSCVIGKSLSEWILDPWPVQIPLPGKGDLPDDSCSFGSLVKGTLFFGFGSGVVTGGLADTFFSEVEDDKCTIAHPGDESARATLYQVLASTTGGDLYDLGRATVVSLLNYYEFKDDYPVTAARIIHMFNSTSRDGGTYDFNATVKWSRTQVIKYLTSLYKSG